MEATESDVRKIAELKYWRREDAEVVVRAWRASGEKGCDFAERISVRPKRLYRWGRLLKGDGRGGGSDEFHPVRVVEREPQIVRQRVLAESQPPAVLAELTREQWTVRVPVGFDVEEMALLLAMVAEVERC